MNEQNTSWKEPAAKPNQILIPGKSIAWRAGLCPSHPDQGDGFSAPML